MPDILPVPAYPWPNPPMPQPPAPSPQNPARDPRQARLWWLAILAVYFAISNAAIVPTLVRLSPAPTSLVPQHGVLLLLIGGLFAQFLILTFFAVLGPGPNLSRQGIIWLVAGVLMGSIFAPVGISTLINHPSTLLPVFGFPTVFFACQAPLWALRIFLRWRTGARDGGSLGSGQITLRGMLATTFFVSFALGMLRLGYSLEKVRVGTSPNPGLNMIYMWMALGFTVAIALVVSTLMVPISSLLVLRAKFGVRGVGAAAAYLVGCALTIILIIGGVRMPLLAYISYLLLYLIIAGYLLIALAIFRSAGYRLWWGGNRSLDSLIE